MKRVFMLLLLSTLLVTACGPKKTAPIEPPIADTPGVQVDEPPPPAPTPAPTPPKPAPPRKPTKLDSPSVKPRAASPGDAASLKLVENGLKQMNAGNLEEAEQLLEQALRISPTNGKPYYYLGVVAAKQKNYDRALGFLAQAEVYLNSDSFWMSQVLLQEGLVLKAQNKKAEARVKLQRALQLDPKNAWAESELKSLQ